MLTNMSHQIFTYLTVLLLAVVLPQSAHSFAEFNPLISCTDIEIMDMENGSAGEAETVRVCSPYEIYGPSPIFIENATGEFNEYSGGWDHYFTIYNASAEGLEEGFSENFPVEASANLKVHVRRDDDNTCQVNVTNTVDGTVQACNSCLYCGDHSQPVSEQMSCMLCGTYSADCTNLENGRMVNCESIETVFFPFTGDVLPPLDEEDDDPIVDPPPPRPQDRLCMRRYC